jgi:hypothetical protein
VVKKKFSAPAGIRTPDHPTRSPENTGVIGGSNLLQETSLSLAGKCEAKELLKLVDYRRKIERKTRKERK